MIYFFYNYTMIFIELVVVKK